MTATLEQLAQEWKAIGGEGEAPKLNPEDFVRRAVPILEAKYSKSIERAYCPFVTSLIDARLGEMLTERGIIYRGENTSDQDLIRAYRVVAGLELEMFPVSTGFNAGLLVKSFDVLSKRFPEGGNRGTLDEEILLEVQKRAGLIQKNDFGFPIGGEFTHTVFKFAPEDCKDFERGIFFGEGGNREITLFVERVYEKDPHFLDNLASVQEEVYRGGVRNIPKIQAKGYPGYGEDNVGRSIPLWYIRPLVKYAQQHKKLPYSSGGFRVGPNWDFKEVFGIEEEK